MKIFEIIYFVLTIIALGSAFIGALGGIQDWLLFHQAISLILIGYILLPFIGLFRHLNEEKNEQDVQ